MLKKDSDNIPIEDKLVKLDFSKGIQQDSNKKIIRDSGIIKDCYVCVRPGNKNTVPKISANSLKLKGSMKPTVVINNYGHGGIGWSLMWGSVLKAIEFSKLFTNPENLKTQPKISVIGSGVNGLATVLLLVNNGIKPENITIFTTNTEDTTSHRSGAILSTASVLEKIDPQLEKLYDEVNIETFKFWEKINQGKIFEKLQNGVKKVKAYFGAEKEWGTVETSSGLDIFVEKGLIPPPELVKVKFGEKLNLMRKYDSFYFNTFRLMNALYDYVQNDYKIKIVKQEIKSFDELFDFDYIFNCAGVSNQKQFHNDKHILPIAGHVVTLNHQKIHDFDYVLYSHYIHKEDIGKYTHTNAPLFYLMLKTDDKSFGGLLGGSLLDNYEGGDKNIDEEEYRQILRRTIEIFGEDPNKFIDLKKETSTGKPKF